ncbi:MAG: flagellar biosynthesis protein FlhA [Pseudomonadota bacterium]
MTTPKALTLTAARPRWRGADAALAALVIAVVGLMVVPLPTWLLDLLIASNLAFSVVILLVSLYVSDGLKIAAFPTVLLLTTLVRLALNVSSTRLILLQADAGEVIRAFGQFVVMGNYVVGGVIFLVLTIIQFVVIAKGSERVAEVGARFTLDALPGKQMAIDAELRSGAIDGNEARARRHKLARESQFYGAMDGAMKFVKGDVIASVLIALINLLGGLAIGMLQRGMDASAALKRYGLLTIGDGLVSQIPSLVLATAAGILVTRVASEDPDRPLGAELAAQLLGQPRALAVASGFVLVLAAIPGLPALPFLAIGGLLFAASRARTRALEAEATRAAAEPIQRPRDGADTRFVPVVVPWGIEVSSDLFTLSEDEVRGGELRRPGLRSALAAIRELLFRELGVPLPRGRLACNEALLPRHAVLFLHEIPARVLVMPEGVSDTDAASYLVSNLLPVVRARASEYLGIAETQSLLDQLEQIAPATVRQVVPKPVSVPALAEILRRLVDEGVSVRDLRSILEALAAVANVEKDPANLAEFVRSQLRRPITYALTRGSRELEVMLLDSPLEETVRAAIQRTPAGSFLALAPAAARDVIAAVRRTLAEWPSDRRPILLTQPDLRRFVRKLLETDFPDLAIVSSAELLPDIAIRPRARATLAALEAPGRIPELSRS